MSKRLTLAESRPLAEAADVAQATGGRMLIQVISPGWGASGYYSSDVLEAAAGDRVFPAGTHMYIDHPTETEAAERPVRSVKDLAAVLTEDATWNGEALVGPARVFGPWRDALADMAEDIGVSIRSAAMVSEGEAEGRTGIIVDKLLGAESVDFVTKAGRGGKVLEVLESADATVAERAVARGVAEATANETREQLSNQLRERFASDEDTWLWVRDFDDTNVWYELESPGDFATYQLPYTAGEDGAVALSDEDPVEVRARTTYVPVAAAEEAEEADPPDPEADAEESAPGTQLTLDVAPEATPSTSPQDPAGDPAVAAAESADPSTPSEGEAMSGNTGAGGAAPTRNPRQLIEAQLAEMRGEVAQMRARERAREVIAEALADAWLPPTTVHRLTSELLEGLPVVEDQLDEQTLRDKVTAKRDAAEAEAAEALSAAGVGQPRSLGAPISEAGGQSVDLEGRLSGSFQELGMSESAAKTAAKGR